MLWRVRFCITGYLEIEAGRDPDDAWEKVHDIGPNELVDKAACTVDFEVPECQE